MRPTRAMAVASFTLATAALMGGCPTASQPLSEQTLTAGDAGGGVGAEKLGTIPAEPPAVEPPAGPQEDSQHWFGRSPFGVWLLEEGAMLPAFDTALRVTGFVANPDGTGRVFFRDTATDANDCVRAYVLFNGQTLALDLSAEFGLPFSADATMFFPVVVTEEDSLGLADETGQIALFSKQQELPPEITCGSFEVLDVFEGVPNPHSFGDLVLHFGDLIYNSTDDQIERFDLDTGAIGAPIGPTQGRFMHSKQNLDFWTHCGCGGSPEATRRTLVSVLDTVHTGTDLFDQITIRAAEYLPTTDRLWLHGRQNVTGGRFKFLIVNTNGEPDTLDRAIDFNRDLRGLSFDGTDLWAIVTMASRSVCRIDVTTGRVIESFEVPDQDISWTGLEPVGNDLYLIGSDANFQGVLYRLVRP